MSRRPSLPGAAELFRVTGGPAAAPAPAAEPPAARAASPIREVPPQPEAPPAAGPTAGPTAVPTAAANKGATKGPTIRQLPQTEPEFDRLDEESPAEFAAPPRRQAGARRRFRTVGERRPSGRQRHEEKITVYCSAEELVDLEQARLALRAEHGLAVDRGRIVREAVAVVLADLEAKGESSILVRRLRES
jgi:hypothetical protein